MTSTSKTTPSLSLEQEAPRDALRELLAVAVQDALRHEFDDFLGAAPYERSDARRGLRNGSYERTLETRVGSLTLRIPRDRAGLFQPSLFAKYERSEQALVLSMAEMYVQGVSTRKVTDVIEVLCGTSVSASEVSTLARRLDVALTAWRQRRLGEKAYPYVLVDAMVERVRREGHVRQTAVLHVIGIDAQGYREHLGVWTGASESAESWRTVFHDLTERGLHGVTYVVADEHAGLLQSLRRYFPQAVLQRCQVHYVRNAREKVSSEALQQEITRGLADAWAAPTKPEAQRRLETLADTLRARAPKLADWLTDTSEATLGVYALDGAMSDAERVKLRSTNAMERYHAEVRRRTRVVGIFPHEASLLRLVTALAVEANETSSTRRYLRLPTPTPTLTEEDAMRHSA